MAGDYDGCEVGEDALARKAAQDLVREVERGRPLGACGGPTRAPVPAGAGPVDLVGGQHVLAAGAVIGGEARRDHDGVLEGVGEKGRSYCAAEVVVGIPAEAMDHDQGALDLLAPRIER